MQETLVVADDELPWILAVMHDQASRLGDVWKLERQPDLERFAGAQFICQPVHWLRTLWDSCGAGRVTAPRLILKFDMNESGTLTNAFCRARDFHTGDPRDGVRNERRGWILKTPYGCRAECSDTPIIKAFPLAWSECAAWHREADHKKNDGVSDNEKAQKACKTDGGSPTSAKRRDGNANEKYEYEEDGGEEEEVG